MLGARALGELLHQRQVSRNYAGTSPITIASGRKHAVVARQVRNPTLRRPRPMGVLFPNQSTEPSTTNEKQTSTTKHYEPSPTDSWASSTAASNTEPLDEHTAWAHRTALDQAAA